jgi:uncharacterized surface protein with fasciclin (FAS1) repeats
LLLVFLSSAVITQGRAQQTNTIVDVAAGNPAFSTLVEAVTKAELVEALRGTGPFTVFAPTNDAFSALFAQLGVSGIEDLTKEQLTPILLYHVLGQEVPSSALKAGQTAATLQKGLVTILKREGKVTVNGISVVIPDVEASNGVIHAIDRVLLPNDLVAVAAGNPNFSTLVEAVTKAELVDALRATGPFTVFAPTNDAFSALFAQLGVSGVEDLTKEQLTPILLYHVLGQEVPSSALKAGQTAATLQKGLVTILKREGKVTVNGISVVIPDVEASNGVIHAIDRVLLPNDLVAVAAGNPNFSTLVEAVTKAELVDALRATGPFTVFAPTNAAFRTLFIKLGISGIEDLTKEQLTPILLYHVLSGAVLSTDLSDSLTAPTLLEGNRITVSINGSNVRIDNQNVAATDVAATNGVIHVLDEVLLPTGRVTRLTLVNARTGEDIQTIEPGATINLGTLDASQVSVRADVFPQAVGSVVLQLNESRQTENFLPYSLLGDSYLQTPLTYNPWEPQSGEYTITATPYPRSQGRGTAGVPLSVTFSVVGGGASDAVRATVYPNPSDEVANLRLAGGGNEEVQISVYDNYGKLYLRERKQLTGGESRIDLSAMPRGMYLVNVQRGSKTESIRITKR